MDKLSSVDVVLGILYVSGALFLCIVAYQLFIKRFKRNKLKALSAVQLVTSQSNQFNAETKFLIVSANGQQVKIELLDENEKLIETLIDKTIDQDEFPIDFNPKKYQSGKYYLYLTTENASILRTITID